MYLEFLRLFRQTGDLYTFDNNKNQPTTLICQIYKKRETEKNSIKTVNLIRQKTTHNGKKTKQAE